PAVSSSIPSPLARRFGLDLSFPSSLQSDESGLVVSWSELWLLRASRLILACTTVAVFLLVGPLGVPARLWLLHSPRSCLCIQSIAHGKVQKCDWSLDPKSSDHESPLIKLRDTGANTLLTIE